MTNSDLPTNPFVLRDAFLRATAHIRKQPTASTPASGTLRGTAHERHKAILHEKGWSLRTAAPVLGVHFTHLHYVLHGRRESRRLLAAIERMPKRKLTSTFYLSL